MDDPITGETPSVEPPIETSSLNELEAKEEDLPSPPTDTDDKDAEDPEHQTSSTPNDTEDVDPFRQLWPEEQYTALTRPNSEEEPDIQPLTAEEEEAAVDNEPLDDMEMEEEEDVEDDDELLDNEEDVEEIEDDDDGEVEDDVEEEEEEDDDGEVEDVEDDDADAEDVEEGDSNEEEDDAEDVEDDDDGEVEDAEVEEGDELLDDEEEDDDVEEEEEEGDGVPTEITDEDVARDLRDLHGNLEDIRAVLLHQIRNDVHELRNITDPHELSVKINDLESQITRLANRQGHVIGEVDRLQQALDARGGTFGADNRGPDLNGNNTGRNDGNRGGEGHPGSGRNIDVKIDGNFNRVQINTEGDSSGARGVSNLASLVYQLAAQNTRALNSVQQALKETARVPA